MYHKLNKVRGLFIENKLYRKPVKISLNEETTFIYSIVVNIYERSQDVLSLEHGVLLS